MAAQRATASLCAMMSWCFQPNRGTHEDDASMYTRRSDPSSNKYRRAPDSTRSATRVTATSSEGSTGVQSDTESGSNGIALAGYQQPPPWVKDARIEACSLCNDSFDLFTRKHHCRACGLVFCGSCASTFDRVIKYGFFEPKRLCTPCATQARGENEFYAHHLPLMEAGGLFQKHGLLRKRPVELKFVRARSLFQYQGVDVEQRQYHGDVKAILLDSITDLRVPSSDKEDAELGLVITANDQEHQFDAPDTNKRNEWLSAIQSARDVRTALLAFEKQKQAVRVQRENEEIKHMAETWQQVEERKAASQEDRLRRRAERRENLRAKYNLSSGGK